MRWINKAFRFLLPDWLIPPRYQSLWLEEEKFRFLVTIKYGLWLYAVGHLAHHFLIDPGLKLEPASKWTSYRFSMAGLAIIAWMASEYVQRFGHRWVKVPFFVWGFIAAHYQFETLLWSEKVPQELCLVVAFLIALAIRSSPFITLSYFLFITLSSWPALASRSEELPYIISGICLCGTAIVVLRARMSTDIRAFVATIENLETQKRLVEAQMELNNQIKAFLPKIIHDRFTSLVQSRRASSLAAMDQVTRLRETPVACLYSDIRGYTKLSSASLTFLNEVAIPNIKVSTEVVESNGGIPRLVGDLVFSYFDWEPRLSILKALKTGIDLINTNNQMNENMMESQFEIKRFVSISFGHALVGNIGGSENAREITVMGRPANILSRIDQLTKVKAFLDCLPKNAVILDKMSMEALFRANWKHNIIEISLLALNLKIRDFPEETHLYCVESDDKNLAHVSELIAELDSQNIDEFNRRAS